MSLRLSLATALLALCMHAAPSAGAPGAPGSGYWPRGQCGPFPRAQVQTPAWACVGIAAGPSHGLIWPRSILQVAPKRFIVTDMMEWQARGQGRILSLSIGQEGQTEVSAIFSDRNLPHGLALGPDGRVYVGDDDQIWRFDPDKENPQPETVLAGLPDKRSRGGDHWHPLKHIVFDKSGDLIVNMGAPDDSCETVAGPAKQRPYPCPWVEGPKPDAALWKLKFDWPSGTPGVFAPFARGLRNSVALAVHPISGLILQGENAVDLWNGRTDPNRPPDELNIVLPGLHYGWPYCAGFETVMPAYLSKLKDCHAFEPPHMLLPAHSAPLGMKFYVGRMFPELQGKLVIALHGFQKNGHRIVAYNVDAQGKPLLANGPRSEPVSPLNLVDGWTALPGVRPAGRPLAITEASDGAIWFIDDEARAIMVVMRDTGAPRPVQDELQNASAPSAPPRGWDSLYSIVLRPRCKSCHEEMRGRQPLSAWSKLINAGFVLPGNLQESPLFRRMLGNGSGDAMPLPEGLQKFPKDYARLQAFIETLPPAK